LVDREHHRQEVLRVTAVAKASRGNLAEQRKVEANELRSKLEGERARRSKTVEETRQQMMTSYQKQFEARYTTEEQATAIESDKTEVPLLLWFSSPSKRVREMEC
jgi:hypothetical protein